MNYISLVFCGMLPALAFAQEVSQFGMVLGANYATLGGADADRMDVWFAPGEFPEGREPFEFAGNSTKATPAGALGFLAGGFIRLDWSDFVYTRLDVHYTWKGGEYLTTLTVDETYGAANRDSLQEDLESRNPGDTLLAGKRRWVFNNAWLDMPLLLGVQIGKEFSIVAGPHVSVFLHNSFEAHITESNHDEFEGKKSYTGVEMKTVGTDYGYTVGANYEFNEQFQLGLRWASGLVGFIDNANKPDITHSTIAAVASFNFSEY